MLKGWSTPINAKEQYNWSILRTAEEERDDIAKHIYIKKKIKQKKRELRKINKNKLSL
jgi:hypothetical protein